VHARFHGVAHGLEHDLNTAAAAGVRALVLQVAALDAGYTHAFNIPERKTLLYLRPFQQK
jgi:hypothetical protein